MSDWYYLKNRKPVPYKHNISDNFEGWLKEDNRYFETRVSGKRNNRNIRKTYIGDAYISTVFLGLDHSFTGGGPILFETMVFGGKEDGYQTRCATHREALAMHKNAVKQVKELINE